MELFKVLYICATIQAKKPKKQKQSPKASPVQGEGDRLRWKGCKQKIRAHSINSEGDRLRWKGCKQKIRAHSINSEGTACGGRVVNLQIKRNLYG